MASAAAVQVRGRWLEPVAEANPFTTMVDAARALFPIIGVFGPLSAWRYRRAVTP